MSYPITDRQADFITGLCKQIGISETTAMGQCPWLMGTAELMAHGFFSDLNKDQASKMIEWLMEIRDKHAPIPAPPGQTSFFGADQ